MSQLKKGAILSYITIILTNGIGLLLTPFIIKNLGDSEFGLYTLIGSLIAYISILDFGLNNTVIRFVSKFRAEKDKTGEENFLATTLSIYGLISLIILLIGVFLFYNLGLVFNKLTFTELETAKSMFKILIFNLAITLPGGAFTAICSGYEQFVFPRTVNIIKYLSRSILVVGLLFFGGKSIAIVILDTILNILVIIITMFYVFLKLKVVIKQHTYDVKLIKQIFLYSIWIFIFAIVGQFQWTAGQVILGVISSTTSVAIYGVGIMLGTYYGAFSSAISGVFLPMATKMTVLNATHEELTTMMIKIGRFSFMILLLIFGGFLLFGKQFILLWVGNTYNDSWAIAIIVMVGYTIPQVQSFANSILEAKSKFSFKAKVYLSLITLGTFSGVFLHQFYGSLGIVLGATSGWILSQIVMNFYFNNIIKLQIFRFFKELTSGLLLVFIITLAIGFFINYIPGNNWLNLVLKILIYFSIFSLAMFKFGINKEEKNLFLSVLTIKFINKKK